MSCTRSVFAGCFLLLLGYLGLVLLLVPTIVYTTNDAKNKSCDESWLWSLVPAYTSVPLFAIATTVILYEISKKLRQNLYYSVMFTCGVSIVFLMIGGISLHLAFFELFSSHAFSCDSRELLYIMLALIGNFLMIVTFKILEMYWITQHFVNGRVTSLVTRFVCNQNRAIAALCIIMVTFGYCGLVTYTAGQILADIYTYSKSGQQIHISIVISYLPVVLYPLSSSLILAYLLCSIRKLLVVKLGNIFVSILFMNSAALAYISADKIWGNISTFENDTHYKEVEAIVLLGSALMAVITCLLKLLWVLVIKQRSVPPYMQVPAEEMEGEI